MSVKCKIINPDGLLLDSSISSALATGMLQSCTSPSTWCMDSGQVPDWHRATVYVYDDLMYTHEINHLSGIDMAIGIIYEWHMQAYISRWLGAGLRYLQCTMQWECFGFARSHQYSTSSGLVSHWRQATVHGLWWLYVIHVSGIEMLQWNWNVTMVQLMLIHRPWFGARKAPSQLSIYLLNLNQSRETFSMGSINPCRDDPIQHEDIFPHKTIYNVCAHRPLIVHAYV